ncbi:MAG TPA: hypothetical protein VNJ04_05430 [Gemmatimonadaceae bacterium]|nr:hypothetical protein [Gemmatimonadaceae bacterium]
MSVLAPRTDRDVLEDTLAVLQAIRGLLERQQRPSSLSRADRAVLVRLLPAIAGALGSEWFLSRDLLADHRPAMRLVLADLSSKRLGRLLLRADGVVIDGFVIERGGKELGATLFRVVAAP